MRGFSGRSSPVLAVGYVLTVTTGLVSLVAPAMATVDTCRATILSSGIGRANLQHAINQAPQGDTVRVSGRCVGTFVVRKDLTLKGRPTDALPTPTLNADSSGTTLRSMGVETDLAVVGIRISGGHATYGGGIRNGLGRLTLRQSTVRANLSDLGGGIFNSGGSVTLSRDTTVTDNRAIYLGTVPAGGGVYNDGGALVLKSDASVTTNTGYGDGGGIYNGPGGELLLTDSSLVGGNTADKGAGGGIANGGSMTMSGDTTISDTIAYEGGGGIFNVGAVTMSEGSSIRRNQARTYLGDPASDGGGIYNFGTVVMNDVSIIRGNVASGPGSGGGIAQEGLAPDFAQVTLNDSSTIVKNAAELSGGGIDSYDSEVTLNDSSSIAGNTADNGPGGGIYAYLGAVVMTGTSSISVNMATSGGGIYSDGATSLTGPVAGVNVVDNSPDDIYPPPT
jgi:hypothetical protein